MYKLPIALMYWKPTSQKGKVHNTMAAQIKSSKDQGEQYRAKARKGERKTLKETKDNKREKREKAAQRCKDNHLKSSFLTQ